MEPETQLPDSADRSSSEPSRAEANGANSASPIANALPAPEAPDNSPTIINRNRARNSTAAAESLKGKKLAHFELIEPIGVGGMAAVIRANDLQLGRIVALKILPPEMAVDPENISRFRQEARSAAKLDHENIARVYFCGEDQGLHFIAFEFVDGVDLRTLMARGGPLQPDQAIKYLLQITTGLAHAASRGVVHRDIKPSNIIITPEGRAKIVDMGLARSTDVHGGVTQSGVTLGTYDYISPEQAIEPRSADIRSDIYSLGCTFYHLLTGQPPVPEGTAAKKLHHHQNIAPVDPREFNPAIPDELVAVLGKMMAKEPRDRYQRPEQLIQHLLGVAQRMNMPAEAAGAESLLFVDARLPQPPRYSPVLVAAAAIAAVTIIAVILGVGGNSSDSRPLPPAPWQSKPTTVAAANPPAPVSPVEDPSEHLAVEKEQRTAATIDDLARLLADPTVDNIVLTGDDYNLADLARSDVSDEAPRLSLTANHSVKLIGKAKSEGGRPTVRWNVEAATGRDPDRTLGLLNAMSGSSAIQVELQHLKFVVQAANSESPVFAVVAHGLSRLRVFDCEFEHAAKSDSPGGGAVQFEGTGLGSSVLELDECSFDHGSCAVDGSNRALVRARQCAFGPHDAIFLFHEKGLPATANPDRLLAELNHCTVRMRDGDIFRLDSSVSGTIRAGNCLFARDPAGSSVVLVHQQDAYQKVIFDVLADSNRARNVYQGLVYWANPSVQVDRPPQFKDRDGIELAADRPPWKNPQPLRMLDASPRDAFTLQTDRSELRSPARGNAMIGVQHCAWGSLYPESLPALQDEAPQIAVNVRIVEPGRPTDERQHSYPTLTAALDNAPPGDLTILIRHTGLLAVSPQTLPRNLHLTVKPDASYRPVLTLAEKTDMLDPAIFTVRNGSISFKDLQFRLKPAADDDSRWASVVTISGNGQCAFEDCAITLDTNDDTVPALATLTTDPDLAGSTDRRLPKVHLNNCVIRGKGHAIAVRGSRPFEVDADNVLAVLTNSFLIQIGQNKEPVLSQPSQITCRHVTTYLGEAFLALRSAEGAMRTNGPAESGMKITGLVPTRVHCEDCLLVTAPGDQPVVRAAGMDRDTLVKTLLTWDGARNLYGNFQKYLDVKNNGAMMENEWTSRDWLQFTNEGDDSFAHVVFTQIPADDSGFTKILPADYRAKLFDMKRTDANAVNFGAGLNQLPKIDDE